MFDDPKKALKRMDEALRAAELEEQEPEYEPDFEEDEEELLRSARELAGPEPVFHRGVFLDAREEPALGYDEPAGRKKKEKKKGGGKLLIAAIIELLLIWGVLLWWTRFR